MRKQLAEMMIDDKSIGYQLSPNIFVIACPITSLCPLGYVHVYVSDLGKIDCGFRWIFIHPILLSLCINMGRTAS